MNLISEYYAKFLLATCFILISSNSISKETESLKFSFSPGEKISFTQKLTSIKNRDMGKKQNQIDETVSLTKISILKTKTGWDVLAEPVSISMKRNGEIVNNPIVNLLSSAIVTYKLDTTGNIIDVIGYEDFIDGISKQVPPQVFQQLAPVLNLEALKSKEIAEWSGRIGNYLGAVVKLGDTFSENIPYQLPDGSTIKYDIHTKIAALEPCAGKEKQCIRIAQTYDS